MTSKVPNDLEATQEASLDALPALLDLLISAIQSHTERAGTNFTREAAEDRVDLTLQELGDLLSAALEDEDKSRFSTQDVSQS